MAGLSSLSTGNLGPGSQVVLGGQSFRNRSFRLTRNPDVRKIPFVLDSDLTESKVSISSHCDRGIPVLANAWVNGRATRAKWTPLLESRSG